MKFPTEVAILTHVIYERLLPEMGWANQVDFVIVLPRVQAAPVPAGCTSSNGEQIDPQRSRGAKTAATAAEPPPDETATVAATAAVVGKRARRNQPGASEDDGGRGKKAGKSGAWTRCGAYHRR